MCFFFWANLNVYLSPSIHFFVSIIHLSIILCIIKVIFELNTSYIIEVNLKEKKNL